MARFARHQRSCYSGHKRHHALGLSGPRRTGNAFVWACRRTSSTNRLHQNINLFERMNTMKKYLTTPGLSIRKHLLSSSIFCTIALLRCHPCFARPEEYSFTIYSTAVCSTPSRTTSRQRTEIAEAKMHLNHELEFVRQESKVA
jgi:hypothetical protein